MDGNRQTDETDLSTYITKSAVGKVWSSVNNNLNDLYGDLLSEELKPLIINECSSYLSSSVE